MIGRIRGTLAEKQPPEILVDVAGVGYEIHMPMTSFYQLPAVGEEVVVYTHFVVREDAQLLFGFADKMERGLFRELIKANGVGPKLGLAILSGMSASQFLASVQNEDVSALVSLPGIGKKTAERLVVEMKDKISEISDEESNASQPGVNSAVAESINALVNLGYKTKDAKNILDKIESDGLSVEELIRQALKSLNK